MNRIGGLSSFLVALLWAGPAHTTEIWVFGTTGPHGERAGQTIVDALRAELPDVDVTPQTGPSFLRVANVRLAKRLGKVVGAGGAVVGVATSMVKNRRKLSLVVVVVTADGRVVFDKRLRLPKRRPDTRIVGLMRSVARAIQDELRASAPPEPEPEPVPAPEPESIAATPVDTEPVSEASTSPVASLIAPEPEQLEPAPAIASRRRDGRGGFHLAVRAGPGGMLFNDTIATTVQGGELEIDVGMTMLITAGLQLQYDDWFVISGSFRYYGATIAHGYEGDDPDTAREEPRVDPPDIDCTGIGITVLVGSGMHLGPLIGGLHAGVAYDTFAAARQTVTTSAVDADVAVLVPSWTRLSVLAGVTLGYGNLATQGLSGELGGAVVPFAVHKETPRTSGSSSTVLGGQGWLRVRYAFSDLFGSAGGLFVDLQADVDFLKIQYKGNGTRQVLGGTDAVQASKERRLSVGAATSLGYVF